MLVSLGSPSGSFHQWHGGHVTRIESQPVAHCELSRFELDSFCGCLHDALRFSRVGPVHLAHGVGWARLEASDSLRWPFLNAPVIHWPAVAVRPVVSTGWVNRPGQNPWGSGALAWCQPTAQTERRANSGCRFTAGFPRAIRGRGWQLEQGQGTKERAASDRLTGSPPQGSKSLHEHPMRLELAWVRVMRWRSLRLKLKPPRAPITGCGT